jgi:hypothetical protein
MCLLRSEGAPGIPRLYRRQNAETTNLGPGSILCDAPKPGDPIGNRCEDFDDLSALLGTGKVCGPAGYESRSDCPGYPPERVRREAPAVTTKPCSSAESACGNVQISVHETSGTVTRILFYDDPGCHKPAQDGCPGSEINCYYRVLAVTSELR